MKISKTALPGGNQGPPSVPTPTDLKYFSLGRCRYCDEGLIEANVNQFLALPASPDMIDIDLHDPRSPKLFVFGRDPKRSRPCVHMVDLTIYTHAFYPTWRHRWLARLDSDALLEHAWDQWNENIGEDGLTRKNDFQLVRVERSKTIQLNAASPARVIHFAGDILTAREPLKFLQKLRASYQRAMRQSA